MASADNQLEQQLEADLVEAMKARDEIRLQVLRLLKAALKNYSIEVRADLSPQQVLQVLQKEAKKRQDSIQQYGDAGRDDLVKQEQAELEVLQQYLPAPISEEDIRSAVKAAIADGGLEGQAAMGQVIAAVREKFDGAADGSMVARIAREELA